MEPGMRWQPHISAAMGGLILVLSISLGLRLALVPINALSYDEGMDLMCAALVNQGFRPYVEVFESNPPLALRTLQLAEAIFGGAPKARNIFVGLSLLGIGGIYWTVRRTSPSYPAFTGLVAAWFLSFAPEYLLSSVSLDREVPALAVALLSMALVDAHAAHHNKALLVLAGVLFGLSLSLKVFVFFMPVVTVGQLVLSRLDDPVYAKHDAGKGLDALAWVGPVIQDVLIWTVGFAVTIVAVVATHYPEAMLQQVVFFRLASRELHQYAADGIHRNLIVLSQALQSLWPWILGTVLGVALLGKRQWRSYAVWLLWLILATVMVVLHMPLRLRHTLVLLPPLAAISSLAVGDVARRIDEKLTNGSRFLSYSPALVICLLMLMTPLSAILRGPNEHPFDNRHPEVSSALDFVIRTTNTDERIVVDDQRFAWLTHRWVPPELSETSISRITSGLLTAEQVVQAAVNYGSPIVVIQTERFAVLMPDLLEEVATRYALRLEFRDPAKENRIDLFAVQMNNQSIASIPLEVRFSGGIQLKGADLSSTTWRAGQAVSLSSYWATDAKQEKDYKIFLHLTSQAGETVATFDHYPFASDSNWLIHYIALNEAFLPGVSPTDTMVYPHTGLIPTRLWIPGNVLKETYTLDVPDALAAGNYQLVIGLYDEPTLAALPVQGQRLIPGETGVLLATITVSE
jgi:hypothetical protein